MKTFEQYKKGIEEMTDSLLNLSDLNEQDRAAYLLGIYQVKAYQHYCECERIKEIIKEHFNE